jgi:hypothetical protein
MTFNPGETTRSFTVPIINDTLDETNETVLLFLSKATNGVLANPSSAVLTIIDDDPPTVRFSSATYSVNENAGSASIGVQLSKPYSQTVFVDYMTTGGTASPSSDYVSTANTLTFAPGQTTKSFLVTIQNDSVAENSETVGLVLTNFFNCTGGLVNATLTIVDDDTARLSAGPVDSDGNISLTISGQTGQRYSVEASTTFGPGSWVALGQATNTTGSVPFSVSAKAAYRFFRAVVLNP